MNKPDDSFFWSFFHTAPIAMTILDVDGQIVLANKAMEEFLGYSNEELRRLSYLELTDDQTAMLYDELFAELVAGERPYFQLETRYYRKDGAEVWGDPVRLALLADSDGERRFLAMVVDITERKRLRQNLVRSEKVLAVAQLAGSIAHDFNNVLTIILSFAQLSLMELPDDDPVREYQDKILEAVSRGSSLAGQLLKFSRQETDELQAVDVNESVRDMEMLMTRVLGDDVELELKLAPTPPISAVEGQISQLLVDLAIKGREAMTEGGCLTLRTCSLTLTEHLHGRLAQIPPGAYAVLEACYTGVNIQDEALIETLQPFFTTSAISPPHAQSGAGLSTIYGIVREGKGYIDIHAESDRSTTISIYLPVMGQEGPHHQMQPAT